MTVGSWGSKSLKDDPLIAGLVLNVEKSVLTPNTVMSWLGMTWNSDQGVLSVAEL